MEVTANERNGKKMKTQQKNHSQKFLNFIRYPALLFTLGRELTVLTTPLPMATLHYSNSTSLMHKWEDK